MIYYNLADQGFKSSSRASVGVYNVSIRMAVSLASELHCFASRHGINKLPSITTAGIGFDHLLSAPCDDQRAGILLYVSAWPHKATASLLPMLQRWQRESGFSEPVYLLGALPEGMKLESFANWRMMGTLEETEYRELLGRVRCSVFNSEYEGFGMPPGEALIQGATPVYSSIPALDEVMKGVGLPYNNDDYESFAYALNEGLTASREQLAAWKKEFTKQNHWAGVTRKIKKRLA